jgi:hypothetical protein
MPNESFDFKTLGWPKCGKCERIMRLVDLEPHGTKPHACLHTYECEEGRVVEIMQM